MNKQLKSLLIIAFLAILIVSCDLFTGPKDDLFRTISNEADWANAEKLTVRIDYPDAWGRSNPVQGAIAMDIRKGFEFSLEFTTRDSYTLQSWQAYLTSDLDSLGNWLDFPELINSEQIQALGPDDVTLPAPAASGGTFKFTINTVEPVTLIPWCDDQPRIVRTEPRNNPDGAPYSIANDIVLYFNCAFNTDTAKFANAEGADGIWITAKDNTGTFFLTNKAMNWFYDPEYAVVDGFFTVTISAKADNPPPSDSLITVTVKGVANARSGKKDNKGYSFSWKTKKEGESKRITEWSATFYQNGNKRQINISANTNIKDQEWNSNDNGKYYLKLSYRLDNGPKNEMFIGNKDVFNKFAWNPDEYGVQYIGQINYIPLPDDKGVREGRPISGIREYTVIIELYEGKIEVDEYGNVTKIINEGIIENKVSFKIWNILNMRVTSTNPAVEVKTAAELAAMKDNLGGQYVLANDIFVSGAWTPVGKYDVSKPEAAFHGKFYGNGHTITLNKSVNANDNSVGLFGHVTNFNSERSSFDWSNWSVIRDLNLIFDGTINNSTAVNFGGIAGIVNGTDAPASINTMGNGVEIRNIITGGGIQIGYNKGPETKYLGGIVGQLTGYTKVNNCHAGTDIEILYDQGEGDFYLGGVVGRSLGGAYSLRVEDISCSGSIDSMSHESWNPGPMKANSIILGGIIGEITGTSVSNTDMTGGLYIIKTEAKNIKVGGIIGNVKEGGTSNISNSYFLNKGSSFWIVDKMYDFCGITITDKINGLGSIGQHVNICAGGVVGNIDIDTPTEVSIKHCYSVTDILITGDYQRDLEHWNDIFNPVQVSDSVYVGGLAGRLAGKLAAKINVDECYALGDIKAYVKDANSGNIYAGGLVGYMDMKTSVRNTFTSVYIRAVKKEITTGKVYVGGIAGYRESGLLTNNVALCYDIRAQGGADRRAARVYCGIPANEADSNFKNYANEHMFFAASDNDNDNINLDQYYNNAGDFYLQTPQPENLGEKKFDGEHAKLTFEYEEEDENGDTITIFYFKTYETVEFWLDKGFTSTIWDFSALSDYPNHPKLKGLGGQ